MRPSLTPAERLIVALDLPTLADAEVMIDRLFPTISTFKIGYWLLFERGVGRLIDKIKACGGKVFLDMKLLDIPETLKRGIAAAIQYDADFVTVHAKEAALDAAMEQRAGHAIKIMAVTALSSHGGTEAHKECRLGLLNAMLTQTDGVIMAPADLHTRWENGLRSWIPNMIIATPGVRLAGEASDDHQRAGDPAMAIRGGADYLIVGRPILRAQHPLEKAQQIIQQSQG